MLYFNPGDDILFDSPIGGLESVDGCLKEKIEVLCLMSDRLDLLQSYNTITSLYHYFAIPKMMHILFSAPCLSFSFLTSSLLKSILINNTNIDFKMMSIFGFRPPFH